MLFAPLPDEDKDSNDAAYKQNTHQNDDEQELSITSVCVQDPKDSHSPKPSVSKMLMFVETTTLSNSMRHDVESLRLVNPTPIK